jgi:hypothetical protein
MITKRIQLLEQAKGRKKGRKEERKKKKKKETKKGRQIAMNIFSQ